MRDEGGRRSKWEPLWRTEKGLGLWKSAGMQGVISPLQFFQEQSWGESYLPSHPLFLETGSHFIAHIGLEFTTILLPHPPKLEYE